MARATEKETTIPLPGDEYSPNPDEPPVAPPTDTTPHIGTAQMRQLHALLRTHGITTDDAVHEYLAVNLGRAIGSRKDITAVEAGHLIAELEQAPVVLGNGIYGALAAVMADVGAVAKDSRNTQQNFNFRGVDAVVNAVSPALRKHRVVVLPDVRSCDYVMMPLSSGKSATVCRVIVAYRFVAVDGSHIETVVAAEAFDMGDKATPKAMSVAFRTALLQALALPTDDPDPDSQVYEAASYDQQRAQRKQPPPLDVDLLDKGTADLLLVMDAYASAAGKTFAEYTHAWRNTFSPPLSVPDLDDLPPETVAAAIMGIRAHMGGAS